MTLDFSDRTMVELLEYEMKTSKTMLLKMAVTTEQEPKTIHQILTTKQYVELLGHERDVKGDAFKDDGDDRAGAENNTFDFNDGAVGGVIGTRDGDSKSDLFEDGGDSGA